MSEFVYDILSKIVGETLIHFLYHFYFKPSVLVNNTLTLIWVGVYGVVIFLHLLVLLYYSKTIKVVTLAFCSNQELYIKNIRAKLGIPNSTQTPDTDQNSDQSFFYFWFSGQLFIVLTVKTHTKLGPVNNRTKVNQRNTSSSTNLGDKVMLTNCNVIVFFFNLGQICRHLESIMVYKTYIFSNSNLLFYRT